MTDRLCIPIEVRPEGGMYTFIGNLTSWLARQGLSCTRNLDDDYDVLFVNSWVIAPETVRRVKQAKPLVRVVHRVDGSAEDYGGNPDSDRIQARVNTLADTTIFQSEYSRVSTREKFKLIARDGPVIYNPVDIELFSPEGPRRRDLPAGRPLVACASWSVNRRKGTWQIETLAASNPDIVFVLCGRFDAVSDQPNIIRLGHLSREAMAEALRSCHLFLNLSENDPCPNVVLEALASGVPVLYRHSGGVPELVGDCGRSFEMPEFRPALDQLMNERTELSARARRRVVERFSPDTIFPAYMRAISGARRTEVPSALAVLKLAAAGYPVLPGLPAPGRIVRAIQRRASSSLGGRTDSANAVRVGWVTYDSFPGKKRHFRELDSFTGMRVGNVARWMNDQQAEIVNELYDPERRYAAVVFQKMMDVRCQAEAEKIRAAGGKVVFDANVNYYEIWGDYVIPGTRPTPEQQRDATWMTRFADWVVADSTYLAEVIRPMNPNVTWIPDNVDTRVYTGRREHRDGAPFTLVWSGIGKKAANLLVAIDAFAALRNAELVLVTDAPPDCLAELSRAIPCRVVTFSDRRYARTLLESDAIVSPKLLVNAYEMGHTEYKITLGMAVGLPAVASPQQSYVEAIGHLGGGRIASSTEEWSAALSELGASARLRTELGAKASQTVAERYTTPVVGAQYLDLLRRLVGIEATAPGATR